MTPLVIEQLAAQVAHKAAAKVKPTDRYGIDPITIIICISIIVNIIRVIQECNKNKTAKMLSSEKTVFLTEELRLRSTNMSFLNKWRIKNILKRQLNKDQYRVYGDALYESLLESGTKVTEEQVSSLLEYKNV